jgi:hypothetical protein
LTKIVAATAATMLQQKSTFAAKCSLASTERRPIVRTRARFA